MGQEIAHTNFSEEDFVEFKKRLRQETKILMEWFHQESFEETSNGVCGMELEAWLVDSNYQPAPRNQEFLEKLAHPLLVPELSRFNFEMNNHPHPLEGHFLRQLEQEIQGVWKECEKTAEELGLHPVHIGILPTLKDEQLHLENTTPLRRYFALNQQVLARREGRPVQVNIQGEFENLEVQHPDILLEAAATSLQTHLQVNLKEAVRFYNASHILSSVMVAVTANSPFYNGIQLWDETRIPLFEQAVPVASFRDKNGSQVGRVTFGAGYRRGSMLEPFLENLDGFPILLPLIYEEDPIELSHLRLHNGCIWRWNRPIIGSNADKIPHLRIEHRVTSAGPSLPDIVANIALFLGLVHKIGRAETPIEEELSFEQVKENFYSAAKYGLKAEITWHQGKKGKIRDLLLAGGLLNEAKEQLLILGLAKEDVEYYFEDILRPRIESGQNGASWQKAFIQKHGKDFPQLTHHYIENQKQHLPVHQWKI